MSFLESQLYFLEKIVKANNRPDLKEQTTSKNNSVSTSTNLNCQVSYSLLLTAQQQLSTFALSYHNSTKPIIHTESTGPDTILPSLKGTQSNASPIYGPKPPF